MPFARFPRINRTYGLPTAPVDIEVGGIPQKAAQKAGAFNPALRPLLRHNLHSATSRAYVPSHPPPLSLICRRCPAQPQPGIQLPAVRSCPFTCLTRLLFRHFAVPFAVNPIPCLSLQASCPPSFPPACAADQTGW